MNAVRDWRRGLQLVQLLLGVLLLSMLTTGTASAQSNTSNGITFSDVSLVAAQRGVVYETMAGSTTTT